MTLRTFTLFFLFAAAAAAGARIAKTIDRDWTFQYSPAPEPDPRLAHPGYDDSRWPAVALPHTWSTYTGFSVDITKQVRFGEPNVLAVQVSNLRDDNFGRIPPMTAGNFDVYGGIYREVRLVIRDRLSIPFQGSAEHEGGTFVSTPEVSDARATVEVRTWVSHAYPDARAFSSGEEPPPSPAPAPAPAPPPTREQKRQQIRAALFVPDPLPALRPESYGQIDIAPGVIAERVSYATDYGLRVPAIVYRPARKPSGKMPGLIVVNGHGGDKYSWYAFYAGILYARAGAVVLTYDPIGEGERNAQRKNGTRQHDRSLEPEEMGKRMGGLMMTDVMQAVSYLAQRPGVDAGRLAAMGYSVGSFVLGLACATETRLNSCVLVGGGNLDGEGGYWDASSKKMCQAIPYQSMKFLGDRGAALYDLHADRGATLVWNGSADDVVAMAKGGAANFFRDLRQRTIALHGSSKDVFEFGFTEGTGHRPYFVTRPVALWLEKRLAFPNWMAESVARMPETHILEWAEKNGVAMDKAYATESREGGTRALGTDIPAVPHDLLNALPEDRWQRDQGQYVYETWVTAAKARVK